MLIETLDERLYFHDRFTNSTWRLYTYIDKVICYDETPDRKIAAEAGKILGEFHFMMQNFHQDKLKPHVRNFHNTRLYLRQLIRQYNETPKQALGYINVEKAFEFIKKREQLTGIMDAALQKGILKPSVCHNDPKISNMLFNETTENAECIIDFDTVDIGLTPYDFGDATRSVCCKKIGKDIEFNLDFFKVFSSAYFKIMAKYLKNEEANLLFDGLKVMTLELAIRYLMDYLAGGIYFNGLTKEQIFANTLKLLKLLDKIEQVEYQARKIIRELHGHR